MPVNRIELLPHLKILIPEGKGKRKLCEANIIASVVVDKLTSRNVATNIGQRG